MESGDQESSGEERGYERQISLKLGYITMFTVLYKRSFVMMLGQQELLSVVGAWFSDHLLVTLQAGIGSMF